MDAKTARKFRTGWAPAGATRPDPGALPHRDLLLRLRALLVEQAEADRQMLADNARISKTQSAMVLAKLIGQFMFDKAASGTTAPTVDAPKDSPKPTAQSGAAIAGGTK